MNNEFNFPEDGKSIEDIVEAFFAGKINKDIEMSTFINDKGEMVGAILNQKENEEKRISFRTLQNNDWIRVNTYYEDGVCEESYERRGQINHE